MKKLDIFAGLIAALLASTAAGAAEYKMDFDNRTGAGAVSLGQLQVKAAAVAAPIKALRVGGYYGKEDLGGTNPVRYMQDDYYRNVVNLERTRKLARAGAGNKGTGQMRIINFGEDYRKFLAKAENADLETQVAAWLELEAKLPKGMANFLFNTDDAGLDAARRKALGWYMKRALKNKEGILKLFDAAPARIEAAFDHFKRSFPDYSPDVTIYVMPSLMHFDACAWPGSIAFGPDGMMMGGETEDTFAITTAHEVFHTYSFSKLPGELRTFATPLWLEGSATYASLLLNPGVTESEALIDYRLGARCADPAYVKDLAVRYRQVMPKLRDESAESEALSREWFQYYESAPETPSRSAYCLGLQVFKKLAAKYELPAMMTWPEPQFTAVADAALAEMAAN